MGKSADMPEDGRAKRCILREESMRTWVAAAVLGGAFLAQPGWASDDDIIKVRAAGEVAAAMDRLEEAVQGAGATVFARVDHGAGAEAAGMQLAPAELLIFGNPKLGTPAMQDDPLAGLYLPLRVLVYSDAEGQVWMAYEEPREMLDDLPGIDDDAGYLGKMSGALKALTSKAAGF